jgi:hypothetical protein
MIQMAFISAVLVTIAFVVIHLAVQRVPDGCARTVFRRTRFTRVLPLIGHSVNVNATTFGLAAVHFQILDADQIGAALADPESLVANATALQLAAISQQHPVDRAPETIAQQLRLALNKQFVAQGLRVVRCQWQPERDNATA